MDDLTTIWAFSIEKTTNLIEPNWNHGPEELHSLLSILLFDPLTPRLRHRILNAPSSQTHEFNAETFKLWGNLCGSPGNRALYLSGAYHWLRFLLDDLMLDYAGKPYDVHTFMADEATQCGTSRPVDVGHELLLNQNYIESKLLSRLQLQRQAADGMRACRKRAQSDLLATADEDRALLDALFRLTEGMCRPAFFDKILTPSSRDEIQAGIEKVTGKSLGKKIWDIFFTRS